MANRRSANITLDNQCRIYFGIMLASDNFHDILIKQRTFASIVPEIFVERPSPDS